MNLRPLIAACFVFGTVPFIGCSDAMYDENVDVATEALVGQSFIEQPSFFSKETVAVSRFTDCLDAFLFTNDGHVEYRKFNGASGWATPSLFANPTGVPTLKSITAVNNGGRVDLFAVGDNGGVYHKSSNTVASCSLNLTWGLWSRITGASAAVNLSRDKIAASSWASGRLDAFWVTPSGNLGHAWYINNVFQAVESGDTGAVYLQTGTPGVTEVPLEVVSSRADRIDILWGSHPDVGGGLMRHTYYDATQGHWGSGTSHRRILEFRGGGGGPINLIDMAVAKTATGTFDFYGLRRTKNLGSNTYTYDLVVASHNANTDWAGIDGSNNVPVSTVVRPNATPFHFPGHITNEVRFNSALRWNGPADRRDIFGMFSQHYVQIWTN